MFGLDDALLFGAGASALESIFGGGNDGGEDRLDYIKNLYATQAGRTNRAYNMQTRYAKKALRAINKGYGDAILDLGRVGADARTGAMARGQGRIGITKQDAISRGTYGTSAYDAAAGSIYSQTERDLGAIDSQLAGLMSGLKVQRADARAGALGYLGSIQPAYAAARGQGMQSLAQIIAGVQDEGATPVSNALGFAGQFASLSKLLG